MDNLAEIPRDLALHTANSTIPQRSELDPSFAWISPTNCMPEISERDLDQSPRPFRQPFIELADLDFVPVYFPYLQQWKPSFALAY